jgi:hypothetical protein
MIYQDELNQNSQFVRQSKHQASHRSVKSVKQSKTSLNSRS